MGKLSFLTKHSFWASLYIMTGLLLCATGAQFIFTFPVGTYGIHVWAAVYDVILGTMILTRTLALDSTANKFYKLISMTLSLIIINAVSIAVFEVGEWQNTIPREVKRNPERYDILLYTRYLTTISTGTIIICAAIDLTIACVELYRLKREERRQQSLREFADSDYNIFTTGRRGVNLTGDSINRYIRSWVPDAESGGCPSPIFQLTALSAERRLARAAQQDPDLICATTSIDECERERESKVRNANVQVDMDEDQLGNGQVSASSSDRPYMHEKASPEFPDDPRKREFNFPENLKFWMEEEKHTSPTAIPSCSFWEDDQPPTLPPKVIRFKPENPKLPGATLRPDRGYDAELSKETAVAMKLIQEIQAARNKGGNEYMMKRLIEMCIEKHYNEIFKTPSDSSSDSDGKNTKILSVQSQLTSGYNSPSLDRSLRLTPSTGISSSDLTVSQENSLSCVIQHLGDTAVISLFSPTKQPNRHSSVERVSRVLGEKEFLNGTDNSNRTRSLIELKTKTLDGEEKFAKGKIRKWRHLIDKRRRPSLLPELESAIIKSESLAFLSKNELKDRLDQTKNIHRMIKKRVHRQQSLRRADSFGSLEDMTDIYKMSTCI